MGRAHRKGEAGSGDGFRVGAGEAVAVDSVFRTDPSEVGALIELQDGSRMEIQEGDPAGLLRGLAEVESVRNLSDGTYEVLFRNGELARLSPDHGEIAFASGEESHSLASAAFASALAHRNALVGPEDMSSVPETQALLRQLGDVYSRLAEDPTNQDLLREYARLSDELARTGLQYSESDKDGNLIEKPFLPDNLVLGDPNMGRRMAGEQVEADGGESPEVAERRREKTEMVLGAMADAQAAADRPMTPEEAFMAGAGINPDDPAEMSLMPSDEEILESRRAALILSGQMDPETGLALPPATQDEVDAALDVSNPPGIAAREGLPGTIPQSGLSDGRIKMTPEMKENLSRVRRALAGGKRFFVFRGPPGTGKDTLAEIVASGQQQPLIKIQLGGSNDINNAKGGYGIAAVVRQTPETEMIKNEDGTYSEKPIMVRKTDPRTGEELKDDQGDYILEPKMKEETLTETEAIRGELARAAEHPSVIVIQEPEGQEDDMVQLHGFFGDRVGDTGGRSIMIDSPEGLTVPVHDRCTVVITTNEVSSKRSSDGRFQDSTYDRARTIDFNPPPLEESAERFAAAASTIARQDDMRAWPNLANREFTANDMTLCAEIYRELEAAQGSSIVSRIGPRAAAEAYMDLLKAASSADTADAVEEYYSNLKYLMRMSDPDADKEAELNTILRNFGTRIEEVASAVRREADEARNGKKASETADA